MFKKFLMYVPGFYRRCPKGVKHWIGEDICFCSKFRVLSLKECGFRIAWDLKNEKFIKVPLLPPMHINCRNTQKIEIC